MAWSWSWEAGMGSRMQCLSLAIRVMVESDTCITYYQNLIAYRTSTCDFYIRWIASVVYRLLSFQSKLLPLFDSKRLSGVTGKNNKLVCLWYVLECVWLSPQPLSPMVVVCGIARTTVITFSDISRFLYISCMNHVGIVHLKEGEREKKPSIWKIPNNCS